MVKIINNRQYLPLGTTLTTPNGLIIGPTTGFTHLPAMDDFGGVGPDFVECSWDGLYWYTSQK